LTTETTLHLHRRVEAVAVVDDEAVGSELEVLDAERALRLIGRAIHGRARVVRSNHQAVGADAGRL
jgi:hypothetical protein